MGISTLLLYSVGTTICSAVRWTLCRTCTLINIAGLCFYSTWTWTHENCSSYASSCTCICIMRSVFHLHDIFILNISCILCYIHVLWPMGRQFMLHWSLDLHHRYILCLFISWAAKWLRNYCIEVVTLQNRRFLQSILVTAVCLSVCLLLCEKFWKISQSILVTAVCLSVCLSVCLFVCLSVCLQRLYRPHRVSDRPDLFLKIGWRARSRSPLLWKSDMGHNFWTGSDRDFGLDAKRSLYNSASVRYPPFWRTPSRFYITWL